jgi:hypothetical protein
MAAQAAGACDRSREPAPVRQRPQHPRVRAAAGAQYHEEAAAPGRVAGVMDAREYDMFASRAKSRWAGQAGRSGVGWGEVGWGEVGWGGRFGGRSSCLPAQALRSAALALPVAHQRSRPGAAAV